MWSLSRRKKHKTKILILGDGIVEKTSLVDIVKRDLHFENIYKEQEAIFKAAVSGK